MKKHIYYLLIAAILGTLLFLMGCTSMVVPAKTTRARLGYTTAIHKELTSLPPPKEPIVVAVYKFRDQTGQYKTTATGGMSWSTAVSQGATTMLLKALEDSKWFMTLEREGLSNLLNERRIIRQTREQYLGEGGEQLPTLPPLLYAGITLEGGIISYETNTITGGYGAKYFGLGGSAQFRRDEVTIYLRAVSTKNGRILKTVHTTKSILSRMVDVGFYRYVRINRLLEIESGFSHNEPVNMCVMEAIEKAIYSLIIEGILDNLWELQNPDDVKSPLVQHYLKEKEEAKGFVQFDEEGNLIPIPDGYTAVGVVKRRLGFGLNGGEQYYLGDYNDPRFRPTGALLVRYGMNPWFSFVLSGGIGKLADKENFEALIVHADLKAVVTLLPMKRLTPYFFMGASMLNFWPEDEEGNEIERERTRGNYWGWKPAVVGGVGLEYFISGNWSTTLSMDHYFTFTDALDGIVRGSWDDHLFGVRLGFNYYLNR